VSELKRELLPLLGFPTNAIWIVFFFKPVQSANVKSKPLSGLRIRECIS
jgi:hypothetical protein